MDLKPILIGTVLILAAGCLADGEAPTDLGSAQNETDPEQAPEDAADASQPSQDDAPLDPLAEPPAWAPGDWWEVRVSSDLIEEDFTVTRVVTGTEDDEYLVGMPKDDWDKRALIVHVPGLGEVRQDDLSFEVHDARFQPLQFPLEDGASWETEYEGDPVEADATVNEDGTVDITFTGAYDIEATYDPKINALASLNLNHGFIQYEVIDHGTGYEGIVTVPHGHDLVFFHGRLVGVVDQSLDVGPPLEEASLSDDYDRVSFMQMVGNLGLVDRPVTSHYLERATSPDGTTFETEHTVTDQGLKLTFHETTDVGGTWSFEHIAPGPGIAFTEGIAYHVYDVDLPAGDRLDDHAQHG